MSGLDDARHIGEAEVVVPPSEYHDVSCALTEYGSMALAVQFASIADDPNLPYIMGVAD